MLLRSNSPVVMIRTTALAFAAMWLMPGSAAADDVAKYPDNPFA